MSAPKILVVSFTLAAFVVAPAAIAKLFAWLVQRRERAVLRGGTAPAPPKRTVRRDLVIYLGLSLIPILGVFAPDVSEETLVWAGPLVVLLALSCSLVGWALHQVPGHARSVKYLCLLVGASVMGWGAVIAFHDRSTLGWLVLGWLAAVAAVGLVVWLVEPDQPIEPGRESSARAFRIYRAVTWWQGTDLPSLMGYWLLSTLGLAWLLLLLRYAAKARLMSTPIVYLRSFQHDESARVFTDIVVPATHRTAPVTGLVHVLQPSSALQRQVPLLMRSNFTAVGDEQWKEWVDDRLSRAMAAVIDISVSSESVSWELGRALMHLPASRVVILRDSERPAPPPPPGGITQIHYGHSPAETRFARQTLARWVWKALHAFDTSLDLPLQRASPLRRQLSVVMAGSVLTAVLAMCFLFSLLLAVSGPPLF